jgi:hypothetical protein
MESQQPVSYYAVPPPMTPRRPASITTIGVIGIVLGSLAILNHFAGLLLLAAASVRAPDAGFQTVVSLLSLPLAGLLLASSIGVLRLAPWGRQGIMTWTAIYIPFDLITGLIYMISYIPQKLSQLNSKVDPAVAQAVACVTASMVLLALLIFPIATLIVMRGDTARGAFRFNDAAR